MIFESSNGYKVGLFRVKETDNEDLLDFVNKTITFTGYFSDLNNEDTYIFQGEYTSHDRYGYQYVVKSYERVEPVGKDSVIEFLSSNLIKGCGEKTALKIVETLGEDALTKIKENINNLLLVPGITENKAKKIYNSIIEYSETDELIVYLKDLGFSVKEALNLINEYGTTVKEIINNDIYEINEVVENFKKVDTIYLTYGDVVSSVRVRACILESMRLLGNSNGNTYHNLEEIYGVLKNEFKIYLEELEFKSYLNELVDLGKVVREDDKYFLDYYYEMECSIADNLKSINNKQVTNVYKFEEKIKKLESRWNIKYNKDQRLAIRKSLENNIVIITGGPGTGKTTIIKAITDMYIDENNLDSVGILQNIALLAPTGRASRRMSEATGLPAMTIHRYLKWNKDSNDFGINEHNKNFHKLIIVDEASMIDTYLFDSLLKGINSNIKLILVGDANQLPSVAPGMILNDLISSEKFIYCPLEKIYRQSANSYIPYLCQEIKTRNISRDFESAKDDYNFLTVPNEEIKNSIVKICEMGINKGLNLNDIQVLAPMYKGENGIDNLNIALQKLFNPKSKNKEEIKIGDTIYREGDKVLQLVNDPDNNVFNGDIGYIDKISKSDRKDIINIDFDGNNILYKKEDMNSIKHAYAISIHKSQGSEFNNVIIPISNQYYKMLYNKLIYTGISRAKKSLVLIGNKNAFLSSIDNSYSESRKTNLKIKINEYFTPTWQ